MKSLHFNVIEPEILIINFLNYAVANDTVMLNLDKLIIACKKADSIILKNQQKYNNSNLNIAYNYDISDGKLYSDDISNTINTYATWGYLVNIENLNKDYLICGITADSAKNYIKTEMNDNIKNICDLIYTEYENLLDVKNERF